MSDETVVKNGLSVYGLRQVHVIRMGKPVERENWLHLLPVEIDWHDVTMAEYLDKGMGIHHLWINWHAREMIQIKYPDGRPEISFWWWIGTMGVRLSTDCAATVYRRKIGKWPERVMIGKLPKGAQEGALIEARDMGDRTEIPLRVADWVPSKFVVVA